ncbi:MAG: hypothetical protein GX878_03075 [Firmicutes bacterium]|nr:hypothetical protein [Bacillota bacterium]
MELPEFIVTIQEILGGLIQKYGAWGAAAAMLAESAGVPFTSSVVLIAAGGMILKGKASFWTLMLASTGGIIAGSIISYIVGFLGGSLGRVMGNQLRNHNGTDQGRLGGPGRLKKVYAFIEKYGTYSIFVGQLWGVTRTFISFPAGALHMNFFVFIVSTALGGAIFSLWIIGWSLLFTGAAGLLFRLARTLTSISPWIWPLLILCVAALIYFYRAKGWKISFSALLTRLKK